MCFFSVDDVKMILIITVGSTSGVFVVVVLRFPVCTLLKLQRKRRQKKMEVNIMVVPKHKELNYQQKEGATSVEKMDHLGSVPTLLYLVST